MLFKEYCILLYVLTIVLIKELPSIKKSSYCKDRANQGRVNQGLIVLTSNNMDPNISKKVARFMDGTIVLCINRDNK